MRGRAGRKGKDELGETYLCCRKGKQVLVVATAPSSHEFSHLSGPFLPLKLTWFLDLKNKTKR